MRGDLCCPLAHALLEFATPAQLLLDMIHYVCLCENPRPGKLAHTLGGVKGLVGGYQFIHWPRPPGTLVYSQATDLACVIKEVFNALYAAKGKEKDTQLLLDHLEATLRSKFNRLRRQLVAQP